MVIIRNVGDRGLRRWLSQLENLMYTHELHLNPQILQKKSHVVDVVLCVSVSLGKSGDKEMAGV